MNHTEYFYDETYFEKSFAVQHRVDKPLSFEAFSNSLVLPYKKVNTEAGEKIGGGIVAWGGVH